MDKPFLVECPVCVGKVSSEAKSCPHCGHPLKVSLVALQIKSVAEKAKGTAIEVKDAVYEGVVDNPKMTYRGYVVSAIGHIALTWVIAFAIVFVFGAIGLTVVGSMAILTAGAMTCKMFPTHERYARDLEEVKEQEDSISLRSATDNTNASSIEKKEPTCDICGKQAATHRVVLKVERRKAFDRSRQEIEVSVCKDCQSKIHSRHWRTFRFFIKSLITWFLLSITASYIFSFSISLEENIHTMAMAFGVLMSICLSVITMILVNPNRGIVSYLDTKQMRKLQSDAWEIVDVEE